MRIEVENLTPAAEPFEHSYEPARLELDDERVGLVGGVKVEGRASRKGEEVRLKGSIDARAEVACDRCLKPVVLPLEVEFDAAFIPESAEAGKSENVELLAEDLGLDAYEGDAVDLDQLVREQILLAVPTRLVCREDCKGLCAACGADLNENVCACDQTEADPRWAALADWKDKDRDG